MSALLLLALGCNPGCELNAGINPSCGLVVNGGPLRLGDERSRVERRLGEPRVDDLGEHGLLLSWPELFVSALIVDDRVEVAYANPGFLGTTTSKISPGSPRSDVESALPDAAVEPFTGALQGDGITVTWTGEEAGTIAVW